MSVAGYDFAGRLEWPKWPRVDDRGIARYVTPQANRWLSLSGTQLDVDTGPTRYRAIAQEIYTALAQAGIRYALEEYHPSAALQTIRTPQEVLVFPKLGTCLDLATLYCGFCSAYELLSLLIIVEDHALAAVSLTHGLRDWNAYRPGRVLFEQKPLVDVTALRELLDRGSFLPVECTGFAQGPQKVKGPTGTNLTFDDAVLAGRAHFAEDRTFKFAVDVAVAHYGWRVEPYAVVSQPGAWTTDVFRVLSDAAPPLAGHLRVADFERLVKERTRAFVGRDFVFKAIDGYLENSEFSSGYVLIRGEPGIGKTSLLCQLIKSRGYLHHFNIAQQGICSARLFLANLCAQLVVRYQLPHAMLPPDGFADSALLSKLLDEAIKTTGGKPIVIIVDALDEAEDSGVSASENRLCLPPVLPDGVFFILSTREQIDYRLDVDHREDIYLKDSDPRNLEDIARYISAFLELHVEEMTARIDEWGVVRKDFTTLLTERSEGNFMYLVHVLNDILAGRLTHARLEKVEDLPKGLRAYYLRHWRTMRAQDQDRFERIYEPVLRILATVREPVTLGYVYELTQIDSARLVEVVRDWRPFLNELQIDSGEATYRVYHASFQDFLAQEGLGLKPFHELIARNALAKIPGFLEPNGKLGKTEDNPKKPQDEAGKPEDKPGQ